VWVHVTSKYLNIEQVFMLTSLKTVFIYIIIFLGVTWTPLIFKNDIYLMKNSQFLLHSLNYVPFRASISIFLKVLKSVSFKP